LRNKAVEVPSRRLVLRVANAVGAVSGYAATFKFPFEHEIAPDPAKDVARHVTWRITSQVLLHYSEDLETGLPYIYVTSTLVDLGLGYMRHAEQHLPVYSWHELVAGADGQWPPEGRAKALLRLALGSPREYEPALAERVFRAGRDPDQGVRFAALYATSYAPDPKYRPFLRDLAANDPSPEIREDATYMLETFDEIGVGEA
jgi:hypothetical protein